MRVSRRQFTQGTIGSLLTYSLLETLLATDAIAGEVQPITAQWLRDLETLCEDVKSQKLKETDWQAKIEELYRKVDLRDLLVGIDFEKLTNPLALPDNGARSMHFKLPEVEGLPKNLVFGRQIFGLKKGRSVVPHGHNNMATAFLILKGDFHGRHYDRLEDDGDVMIIRPTIDDQFGPGGCSTVSDDKDNVHWFKATSEPAFIFNIHVLNIRPNGKEATGRVYVDPMGEKLSDGRIRAKRIDYKEAHERYG